MSSRAEIMITGMWRSCRVCSVAFQHGEPVESGHHHVEQHEVDASVVLGEALECLDAIAGLHDAVAQLGQPAAEDVSVGFVVVDDQHRRQAARERRRGVAGVALDEDRSVGEATCERTQASGSDREPLDVRCGQGRGGGQTGGQRLQLCHPVDECVDRLRSRRGR
jgi:hypothetical protein